jgi:hypothetical protein
MKRWQGAVLGVGVIAVVVAVLAAPGAWKARRAPRGAAALYDAPSPVAGAQRAESPLLVRQAQAPAPARRAFDGSPGGGAADLELPTERRPAAAEAPDSLRMLIRTGRVRVRVDSLEPAVALVHRIATEAGGYVANSAQTTTEQVRGAVIEIKVPADRFDHLFEGLRTVGKVEVATVTAEDVGEEYTDVAARMANARRLETRLLGLLATRTGRLQDVLEVERELARVREQIERYAGRMQYLRQHVAVSSITIELHEPGTVIGGRPGAGTIGEAFLQAWRNLVWVVAFLIQALGAILPLALVAWGGWVLWGWWRKRRA